MPSPSTSRAAHPRPQAVAGSRRRRRSVTAPGGGVGQIDHLAAESGPPQTITTSPRIAARVVRTVAVLRADDGVGIAVAVEIGDA